MQSENRFFFLTIGMLLIGLGLGILITAVAPAASTTEEIFLGGIVLVGGVGSLVWSLRR